MSDYRTTFIEKAGISKSKITDGLQFRNGVFFKVFFGGILWQLFNLVFICFYQHALWLMICLPALYVKLEPRYGWGVIDLLATWLALGIVLMETIADQQQWNY